MAKQNDVQELSYEKSVDILQQNLRKFAKVYFTSKMKEGDYGKAGLMDGWLALRSALKEDIGVDGILDSLEAKVDNAIKGGEGLNGEITLSQIVSSNASIFLGSAFSLKVGDLLPYIREGLDGVNIHAENKYAGKLLADLNEKNASDEEKAYGAYLLTQLENSVMAKVTPSVAVERAKRETMAYEASASASKNRVVKLRFPGGKYMPQTVAA